VQGFVQKWAICEERFVTPPQEALRSP
jgi:hypothetical protein